MTQEMPTNLLKANDMSKYVKKLMEIVFLEPDLVVSVQIWQQNLESIKYYTEMLQKSFIGSSCLWFYLK